MKPAHFHGQALFCLTNLGVYFCAAHGEGAQKAAAEVEGVRQAAIHAKGLGMIVAAGHGLTYRNVGALAAIPEITEFNIEHNIISRSVFVGLNQAVKEMIAAIRP